jgi:uncharacterized protein (DUF58 family)
MLSSSLLHRLGLLNLHARRASIGRRQGIHKSLRRGHGVEFTGYREYQPGDSPRHIDWSLFARSDRVYVKTFQEEQNLSVLVSVDTSASMRAEVSRKKWQKVIDLVLALSYISLLEQDEVTIHGMNSFLFPKLKGVRMIHRIEKGLDSCTTGEQKEFARDLQRTTEAMKFPGVAVIISDFLFPIELVQQWFLTLARKNLEVNLIQVVGEADRFPLADGRATRVIDSENGELMDIAISGAARDQYAQAFQSHTGDLRKFCNQQRIGFASIYEDDDLFEFLAKKLGSIGLIQ